MGERRGMKALEVWCRRVTQGYPGVSVDNMTTSWRDGLAFCAIIHHFRPDLIDFPRLNKSDVLANNELAFRTAERHLGIPALLDAEDMAEYPVPDKLSIMTYLSQFYQAFASNGASPIKRSSETSDNSLVISDVQSSPPPKRAVLGARKEKCKVCGLPVYIAQRLRVSGVLYHRTCFKCCRCGSQLNPVSCCEMDGDGYACEVCPADTELQSPGSTAELPAPVPPPPPEVVPQPVVPPPPDTDDSPATSPSKSLVGIRRMMFESYIKETDDAKLLKSCMVETDDKDLSDVAPSLDTNTQEDTHSVGDLVESYNVVLASKLDSDSDNDTKLGDQAPETVNPVILHADQTDSLNKDKISLNEAVNIDIVTKPNDSCSSPVPSKTEVPSDDDTFGTPFAENYTEVSNKDYPAELNPFSDDEEPEPKVSTNPFGSSSDEDTSVSKTATVSQSTNPFGSDSEDEMPKKPVPLPRLTRGTPEPLPRNSRLRSSNRSLVSLTSISSRKKRPAPLPPGEHVPVPPSPAPSRASISSTLSRGKKKRAPLPPPGQTSTPMPPSQDSDQLTKVQTFAEFLSANQSSLVLTEIDINNDTDDLDVVCENKLKSKAVRKLEPDDRVGDSRLTEGSGIEDKTEGVLQIEDTRVEDSRTENESNFVTAEGTGKVISSAVPPDKVETPPDSEYIIKSDKSINEAQEEKCIRDMNTVATEPVVLNFEEAEVTECSGRRLLKVPKEARYSIDSTLSSDSCHEDLSSLESKLDASLSKSKSGEGTTRPKKKGRAPMPLAPRRAVKPMPAEQLRQELLDIEIKQQGLERQGIALENKIRDKFSNEDITPYVEELVLQLFELVNEKNELFRRQAELMYFRRQHNLEEEQADLEYQIRKLMAQPEANKTDSDKELEEKLISRLVEVVERRDAIIQCLEMDRLREVEEDKSIHQQLSLFSQAMGDDENREKITKKLKKKKYKLSSLSLFDLDRDLDSDRQKKKKWYTLHNKKNKR